MKINFAQILSDLDGNPIKDETGAAISLGKVAANALLGRYQGEDTLSGEQVMARYELAMKVNPKGVDAFMVDVTPENITLIRNLLPKAYAPIIAGQAYKMLDPQESN